MDVTLRPFAGDEDSLFYSGSDDEKLGTVGHLRADFGSTGNEFRSSWSPHNEDRLNTPGFKEELTGLLKGLRKNGPLKSLIALRRFCSANPDGKFPGQSRDVYGFIAETERYRFCLRLTPVRGDYQIYVYAYDLQHQREQIRSEREELLIARLDECLLARAGELGDGCTISDLHELGRQIDIHAYLTEEHRFDENEVERLLGFQNPLEVAAECVSLGTEVRNVDIAFYLDRANPEADYPLREDAPPQQNREQSGVKPARNKAARRKER